MVSVTKLVIRANDLEFDLAFVSNPSSIKISLLFLILSLIIFFVLEICIKFDFDPSISKYFIPSKF